VHDARYSEQEQNFYRLKIGTYRYAEGMFPLGWKRGDEIEVELFGGNLKEPVKVKPDWGRGGESGWVEVGHPGRASLPFEFVAGERPEVAEPESEGQAGTKPLPPGTVMNGRISRPGEVDRYRLAVTSGQHWNFEIDAATLGTSQLDPFLSLQDPSTNKPLALADLFDKDDPYKQLVESGKAIAQRISFTVPKGFSSLVVAVEDLLGRGGPTYGYRLLATDAPGDFALELSEPSINIPVNGTAGIEVLVKRQGYRGPIRLSIPNLPDDVVMAGGNVPADPNLSFVYRPGYITLTAKPNAKLRALQLEIQGEALGYDPPVRRRAKVPGMVTVVVGTDQKPFKAPWLNASLPAAISKSSPSSLEVPVQHFRLSQGSEIKLPWKLVAPPSMTAPLKVNLRADYFLKDLVIVPKPGGPENPNEGFFQITAGLTTPAVTFDFVLDAVNKKYDRLVTSPAVTIEIVPLYRLKLISEKVELKRGSKVEIVGRVEREPGFKGVIKVRPDGLPQEVSGSEISLAADQNEFKLVLEARSEAKPGEFEIRLASTAAIPEKNEKQEYSIPDLKASLIVSGETVQAAQTN
jgi:hypothetical protein